MSHKHDRAPGSSGIAFLVNFVFPIILLVGLVLVLPDSPVQLGGTYSAPFELEGTVTGSSILFLSVDTARGNLMIPFGNRGKFAVGTCVTLRLRERFTVTATDSGSVRTFDSFQCLGVKAK